MNLMELLVKIGVDDQASDKIAKISSKIGGGLKTAAKVGTAAVGAASAGIAAFTTSAVKNYAEYEQLVGGVETLFNKAGMSWWDYSAKLREAGKLNVENAHEEYQKYLELSKGADMIMANSAEAYKTAGMSANEYMETVTGFSASLIQSLGGDTVKAAEYAHMAIVDMSDNANKMGTDMGMIQNAYGGFAKGNMTMLDNLKLGYGGTQEEMKRLIKDASKLDKSVDANSTSFGNIVKAIHAVQENMKITGTTAKEASETISGSISSMKAAWENLSVAFADEESDIYGNLDAFVESVSIVAGNLAPRIGIVLETIGMIVEEKLPIAFKKGAEIITNYLPKVLEYGGNVLITMGEGILAAIPEFTAKLPEIVTSFGTFVADNLPHFLDMGISILLELGKGLLNALPSLLLSADEIINALFEYLVQLVAKMIEVGAEIVIKIGKGISGKWEDFKTNFQTEWDDLVKWFKELASDVFDVGKDIVDQIKQGISDAWDGLKRWFNNLWDDLFGNRDVNVNVNYEKGTKKDGYHRTGLASVPFDGYMAELHKGERVLTASEARRYDEGGRSLVINQYIEAVPQSPVEIAAATQSYFEGARYAF